MHQRDAARRPVSAKTESPKPIQCTQCGEHLDAERLKKLARGERVLCADCAFDTLPCTD